MGPGIISFMLAAGSSTWLYSKLMRSTGNNTKSVLIGCTVAFLVIFFIVFSILGIIFK